MIEFTAKARFASDSLIPPTPLETILTFAFSLTISCNAETIASHVPPTSVLIITFRIFFPSCPSVSNKSVAVSSFVVSFLSLSCAVLNSAISPLASHF